MSTILVIGNNSEVREVITDVLKMANYQMIIANDGKEGIMLAEKVHPDVIICDLTLPIWDGYVVLQVLGNNRRTSNIPFILLTSRGDRAEIRRGMDLGADDCIIKPFDSSELLHAVECQLRKSEVNRLHPLMKYKSGSMASLQELIRDRNIRYYKNKQVIYQEGNHPSCLYYIMSGKVKTYKMAEEGKEFITGLYNEGAFVGYVALLNETRYGDSAEAVDDVALAIVPYEDFEEMMSDSLYAQEEVIRLLTHAIENKEIQLLRVAYDSLRKKAAVALLEVNEKYHNRGIRFSRGNLAAIAGVAKESFARTLSDFREERIVDIRNGVIYILDADRLRKLTV